MVFTDPALARDFRYTVKQNGGMLAKGRLLGLQFLALLEDGLYMDIARHEVELALRLRDGLAERGWEFLIPSPTNQQFPILPDAVLENLKKDYAFSVWQKMDDGMTAVRFCTGWAATREQIDGLLAAIPKKQ